MRLNTNNYVYLVPFVKKDESTIFLKTIFPHRKLTQPYLRVNSMGSKQNNAFGFSLDEEEQEISKSIDQAIEKRELKSVDNLEQEMDFARKAAANYFRKVEVVKS
jgi:hypothetical protein